MDVMQAINERVSIRQFKPEPVSREVLIRLIQAGQKAPSWANTQPWEFAVAGGRVLDRIREEYSRAFLAGEAPRFDVPYAGEWPDVYKSRSVANGKAIFQLLNIAREDAGSRKEYRHNMFRFFNAPACIFLHMSRELGPWSMYDLGLASENIMLAAKGFGLDTIVAVTLVAYPDILRQHMDIPALNNIVVGIAVGYADPEARVNQHRSPREPLENISRFFGF